MVNPSAQMKKTLTVYKASAGSGKTFTLVTQYIKLLVLNPTCYRNILAVTFTNKATEEMKTRIITHLYGIWKGLPDSEQYLQKTIQETQLPAATIQERAGEALHLLLHNYSYFRVETIDSFFQSVLRNLARELDLTANLRVSLNDTQVEEQAVDHLIDSLTHADIMLQWLLSYIMERIGEDHSWNIIGQVKQFGKTIFRDYYKEKSKELYEKMNQKGFMEGYVSQMRQIRNDALTRMRGFSESFFDTLTSEGLSVEDLAYGKTGVAGFFQKLGNGVMDESIVGSRVCDCRVDASKWYSKKHARAEFIYSLAEASLMPLLAQAMDERPRQWKLYKSADLTLRHLSQLRLLDSIENKVRTLNDEANRFLLSDTQQLLHTLIKDNDSPFIFEKIGTQLEHIMIDEFQDTSTIQWKNFKVLLEECMSHKDSQNLIVGDVKQSIYRWRSGDWRLLNAIDRQFSHAQETVEVKTLDINHRSDKHIVDFNNAFFTEAARLEYERQREESPENAEQLCHAYEDVVQQTPDNHPPRGFVSVSLLPPENYEEETLNRIATAIRSFREQGASFQDMAILVRTNKHIPLIADYFANMHPDIRIVSDEAFRLDASVSVNLIVQVLHLLTHPDDLLAKATVAKLYQKSVLGGSPAEEELLIKDRPLDTLLPEAFTQQQAELLQMPLYELTERLYTIFHLDRLNGQSAYICAFFDQLHQFVQDNTSDIDLFVQEWEETIRRKTIHSDSTDGVRILSVHKSKGLEFKHVILPFCDWRIEIPDILWCEPAEAPFNALPLIPVDFSSQMRGTVYERNYQEEHLQNIVDNLNLLYVAFTRAANSLVVMGQRNAKNNRSVLIEAVLRQLKLEGSKLIGEEDEATPLEFTYGAQEPHESHVSHEPHETQQPHHSQNPFLQPVTPELITLETFDAKTSFRQSNKSRDFIEGDDEQQEISYIKLGSVLHELFSTIRTTSDIGPALQQMELDGILYDDDVTREKLTNMLHKRLEGEIVKNWFSERWKLFNECSILQLNSQGEMQERRPDRVMTDGKETHVVDFKFGSPKPEYKEQVREYMELLRQMGMPQVKGWLWYVYSNKIEEVKS